MVSLAHLMGIGLVQCDSSGLCRPEDSVQSCLENTHQLMALKGSTAGDAALLEAVQLTSAQVATTHKLILCGSLMERGLDVLLLRLTKASLASQESSMKVRACAWRALAEVLAVKPEILAVPVAQDALKSALSEKEKSAQVRYTILLPCVCFPAHSSFGFGVTTARRRLMRHVQHAT